jgi:hypothetical protein
LVVGEGSAGAASTVRSSTDPEYTPVKHTLTAALVLAVAACGSILQSGAPPADTSREYEPPPSWEAGIQFHFTDSTWNSEPAIGQRLFGAEVRFHDGRRERVVTGRELFYSSSSAIHTPWYRVWLPAGAREIEPTLRVTIGDRYGNRTVAEYPLRVMRDGFYRVVFAVYTPGLDEARGWSPLHSTMRVYDVPADVKRLTTDSLRIGYYGVPRDCFNCPM